MSNILIVSLYGCDIYRDPINANLFPISNEYFFDYLSENNFHSGLTKYYLNNLNAYYDICLNLLVSMSIFSILYFTFY